MGVTDSTFISSSELYDADNEVFIGNLLSFLLDGEAPDPGGGATPSAGFGTGDVRRLRPKHRRSRPDAGPTVGCCRSSTPSASVTVHRRLAVHRAGTGVRSTSSPASSTPRLIRLPFVVADSDIRFHRRLNCFRSPRSNRRLPSSLGTLSTWDASGTPSTYHVHGRGDSVGSVSAPEARSASSRRTELVLPERRLRDLERPIPLDSGATSVSADRSRPAPTICVRPWLRPALSGSLWLLVVTVERPRVVDATHCQHIGWHAQKCSSGQFGWPVGFGQSDTPTNNRVEVGRPNAHSWPWKPPFRTHAKHAVNGSLYLIRTARTSTRDAIRRCTSTTSRTSRSRPPRSLKNENDRLRVETASNAENALERLESSTFDCVVSDYDMPERDGLDFLEALREDAPDLPFILFTGEGSEEVASDAISAGVTDYLQKEQGTGQYTVLANRVQNAVEARQSATRPSGGGTVSNRSSRLSRRG